MEFIRFMQNGSVKRSEPNWQLRMTVEGTIRGELLMLRGGQPCTRNLPESIDPSIAGDVFRLAKTLVAAARPIPDDPNPRDIIVELKMDDGEVAYSLTPELVESRDDARRLVSCLYGIVGIEGPRRA